MSERTGVGRECCECGFIITEGQPWGETQWGFAHSVCIEAAQNGVGL